jgi:hypothetical protein
MNVHSQRSRADRGQPAGHSDGKEKHATPGLVAMLGQGTAAAVLSERGPSRGRKSRSNAAPNDPRSFFAPHDLCVIYTENQKRSARGITKDSSNLWASRQTHLCWGFQRPMPKRTPPSDDTPLVRRCAFGDSVRSKPARRKWQQRPDRLIVIGGLG